MIVIDAMGKPCPIPVVEAKRAIATLPPEGGSIRVMVDNRIACENLRKLAEGMGYDYVMGEQSEAQFVVTLTVGANRREEAEMPLPQAAAAGGGAVVAIGREGMGHGSDELGRILIKGFIFSLTQLQTPPQALLLFNSGIRLALRDANTVEDLNTLICQGCEVLVCGTCLDYYGEKERLAVGEVTTMLRIAEWMGSGYPVINL